MLFNVRQVFKTLNKSHFVSNLGLGLFFALSGVTAQAETIIALDNIVAVVNEDVITQLELKSEFRKVVKNLKQKQAKLPPANVLSKQVLDRMILERIQLDLANRTGIKVDDTTLSRAINSIAAQNGMSLNQFREGLATQGVDFRSFRDEVKTQIILKRLIKRNVVNQIKVSDQEIENFLFNVNKQGGIEQSYHLKHILIATPEGASPAIIKKTSAEAMEIVKELKSGKDFSSVALAVSDGQNALEGGDLGWRKAGEIPTLFTDTVRTLNIGGISDPIRSPSGFHIITIIDKKGAQSHMITQTHARHILIKPSIINDNEQVIQRLNQIRKRIINGEDFATMAKAHSEDTSSATRGGDLGWFKPGTMVPQFEKAMETLQTGDISDVIQTSFGYHIIEVLGRRSHDDADELIKERTRQVLSNRKVTEQTDAFYRKIRDEAFIEIRLDNN
ncbi:MAG: peptidylprolyl isomerase [gamma proteobacterium symbiont of Bathyaustriella thionipta]|nr:peptidylprolyl isomerase [gamma proteobacterium symbiont of Bathyaustriella thionipta]MCU7948618.1 peptidylprolyl isomerase [gamma proteobacterium symbiont of Bathyaustriella thionipta]MCU7952877.1 peptidylprolyl isomerase [gamma proteobacterium symbiont of Bathyaustriella thionipta]MCU7955131.1 peptidylprolyl isomerase [gamma proteobacterium symbiont of Bathyaustriella thionipta]MCU7966091.1 peptidylprolyl isomerase [gamma proteobacterium symbiont of Bathyaustriella thionipta]